MRDEVPDNNRTYVSEGRIQAIGLEEWEKIFGTRRHDYSPRTIQGSAVAINLNSLDFDRRAGLLDLAQQAIYAGHYDFIINLVEDIKAVPEGGLTRYLILYTGTGLKKK